MRTSLIKVRYHAEIAGYRELLRADGSWGEPGWLNEVPRYSAYVDSALLLTTAHQRAGRTGQVIEFDEILDVDWHRAARDVLDNRLPAGLVVVQVRAEGREVLVSRPIVAVADGSMQIDVLVDSRSPACVEGLREQRFAVARSGVRAVAMAHRGRG